MAPNQIRAIGKMQPLKTKKRIQTLIDKLVALNKFIFKYSNRLQPFFIALKGASTKEWGSECDKTFHSMKEYVASPIFLSQPVDGEEMYLYLVASTTAVSVALVRSNGDGKKWPIYFVSKMLKDTETRYIDFERITLALKMAERKLRPYFQAYIIVMLTSYLIRVILHKPYASRRLLKWGVKLSEFDIEYRSRSAIKG